MAGVRPRPASALEAAWNLYRPGEHLDRALIALDQATCLLRVGEIGTACQAVEQIIERVPADHMTGILKSRARELIAAIPARGSELSAVRNLREMVAATGQ